MKYRLKLCTYFVLYLTLNSLENHNSLTVTPNLVILEPTISLRYVEHYYVVCYYVLCGVNFAYTKFVCIATSSSEVTSHLKTKWYLGISTLRQVLPLITPLYPTMFLLITVTCLG
jgi:hypothetical protein